MKLPAIPFITKKITTEYFLALIFETDKISSILFKEQEKTLLILASKEIAIDLEKAEIEDLINACDAVISKLELSLPEGATLEKTIFSVPFSWVEEGRIKNPILMRLKKISEELVLTPMGFIVSIEAIIAFLQKNEGAPVNGIFVELHHNDLSIFIVRGGNIIDVATGQIIDGVEKTVERLLSGVTKLDVLPSKIVLLHSKESEIISQKFLSHHWTKDLPFMHLPQVAILDKSFENEAIVNGVAMQLEVELRGEVDLSSEIVTDDEELMQDNDTFGFVSDQDIALNSHQKAETHEQPSDFDFVEDKKDVVIRHNNIEQEEIAGEEILEEDEEPVQNIHKNKRKSVFAVLFGIITPKSMGNVFGVLGNGKRLVVPAIALVVVAIVMYVYYATILKVNVVIFTDQKAFTQDAMAITLSTKDESSFAKKILKIETIEESVDGEQSQETTGQKDTGQKAIGTITIFNKSESPKQLDKGTVVTSSNNLEFTLNDNVNIASTSSFATSFSSAQAKVTADNFGKEYNLPSQTNFTIKGFPTTSVFGRNDSAFSGGTKEEIQIVSKKDLSGLEEAVVERLFDKAKETASSKLSQEEALVPVYLSFDFKDKNFDKKEGDQAKTVKLVASINYSLGKYKKSELANFIESSNDFDVPSDFKLSGNESSINLTDIKQGKNSISAKLAFNAIFKPQLNVTNFPTLLVGKTKDDAYETLKKNSGVSDVSFQFIGDIPILPKIMPLNKDNITIEQKTQ